MTKEVVDYVGGFMTESMFVSTAIIAAVMLCLSLVFNHDHDVDHDVDHDGGGNTIPILSSKIIFIFLVGFGAFGFFGCRGRLSPLLASLCGIAGGVFFAALGSAFMRFLYKSQGNSIISSASLIGLRAIVETSIPPGGQGVVRVNLPDGRMDHFQARSTGDSTVWINRTVIIVESAGGVLTVEASK